MPLESHLPTEREGAGMRPPTLLDTISHLIRRRHWPRWGPWPGDGGDAYVCWACGEHPDSMRGMS